MLQYYGEAQNHNDKHIPSLLALAHLYFEKGDFDAAQQQCIALLRVDPEHAVS